MWYLFFLSHTVLIQDMFGEESVPKIFSGDRITVSVDTRKAVIDLASLEVNIPSKVLVLVGMMISLLANTPSKVLVPATIMISGELHRRHNFPADCADCGEQTPPESCPSSI